MNNYFLTDFYKEKLSNLFYMNVITPQDIIDLEKMSFTDVLNLRNSKIIKNRYLYSIYMNPYLLCMQSCIDIDIIAKILLKRYKNEIFELDLKYEDGEINKEQLNIYKNNLYNLYFKTTFIGLKIEKIYLKVNVIEKNKVMCYNSLKR